MEFITCDRGLETPQGEGIPSGIQILMTEKVCLKIVHTWKVHGVQGWNMKLHPSQNLLIFSLSCKTSGSSLMVDVCHYYGTD